jgi:DNA-binding response OmpR family regulator
MMRKILVIEDDKDIAHLLQLHLPDMGYETTLASDGGVGLQKALSQSFDLILLDLMLPGIDGWEIARQLRAQPNYTPLLMLTARSSEVDRVLGLEVGADDYLTKPFSIRELLARVKAIFRRVDALKSSPVAGVHKVIQRGDLLIDSEKRKVTLSGKAVELTAKEFDLLIHFAEHPGRVYTRSQLLDRVWGYGHDGYEHTVNSHINRLRAKIEVNPEKPQYILTVWGVGYQFAESNDGKNV